MTKTSSWKDFGGKYLKAQNVTSENDKYVIVSVASETENDKTTLILTLEHDGVQKLFGCNTTNENAVQAVCKNSPDEAVGRIITFYKEKVRNPATQQMVDGLRIKFEKTELAEPAEVDTQQFNQKGKLSPSEADAEMRQEQSNESGIAKDSTM